MQALHPPVRTLAAIPAVHVGAPLFSARVEAAATARVGEPVPVTLHLANHSHAVRLVTCTAESDAFCFAGDRVTSFSVAPRSSRAVLYTCVPLRAGRLPLPSIVVTCMGTDGGGGGGTSGSSGGGSGSSGGGGGGGGGAGDNDDDDITVPSSVFIVGGAASSRDASDADAKESSGMVLFALPRRGGGRVILST